MSLTPQQAFDYVKSLWPDALYIEPYSKVDRTSRIRFHPGGVSLPHTWDIDWDGLTRYPPPEPVWRPARKGDEGKKCRYSDSGNTWLNGGVLIACVDGLYFIKKHKDIAYGYNFCEVQE